MAAASAAPAPVNGRQIKRASGFVEDAYSRIREDIMSLKIPPDSSLAVGDHVRILPNHACSVGNLGRSYLGVRNGIIEEVISVDAASAVH